MKHQQTTTHSVHEVAPRKKRAPAAPKGEGAVDLKALVSGHASDEVIRQTAYSLYEERHCVNGYELDDWLQAEAKVKEGLHK